MKIGLLSLLILLLLPLHVKAENFSATNIQYLYGSNFKEIAGGDNFRALMAGLGVDLDIPGFKVLSLDIYSRKDDYNKQTFHSTVIWHSSLVWGSWS